MRALVVALLAACSPPVAPAPPANVALTEASPVTQTGPEEWTVKIVRRSGTFSATGIVVTTTMPTARVPVPHSGLAAARAWREVAYAARRVDPKLAARAALSALEELTRECACRENHSDMRVFAGKESFADGSYLAATEELLRSLAGKLGVYLRTHPGAKAIPADRERP